MFQTVEDVAQEGSTGIGLSIVKTIVEANHGKIWVESKLGQGTTFSFTWPKDIEAFSQGYLIKITTRL